MGSKVRLLGVEVKISVIVPSLEGGMPRGLRDDPRLEIIVVKGMSPVGKARNEGLRRATGEYVAWVDSDDEITEDWVDEICSAIGEGVDVITIDAKCVGWKDRGDVIWGVRQEEATIERLRRDVYRDVVRPSMLWLYVIKRELWHDLWLDESVRVAEDYLLLPKVLARAKSCKYIDKLIYRYVCNEKSLINTQDFARFCEVMPLWERRLNEAPESAKCECSWGMAVSFYWLFAIVAIVPSMSEQSGAKECAKKCREKIRSIYWGLWHEFFRARDFPLSHRIEWMMKFTCAALDFWWVQRRRYRRRRGVAT